MRKSLVGSGDRSERIRTYNFPQGRVTDHRINLTLYRLPDVLEGNIDELTDALIAAQRHFIHIAPRPMGGLGLAEDTAQVLSPAQFREFFAESDAINLALIRKLGLLVAPSPLLKQQ